MMRKFLILMFPLFLLTSCKNKDSEYYRNILDELRAFVRETYRNEPKRFAKYIQNAENGKILLIDGDMETDFDKVYFYQILRRNGNVVYISKKRINVNDEIMYEYYFYESKLIGLAKSCYSTSGCSKTIMYLKGYRINPETNKLELSSRRFYDKNGNIITEKKDCEKSLDKIKAKIENDSIGNMNSTTLEEFMIDKNIKYYR